MAYIFEQKFYRQRTGGRRKSRQDKTVQIRIEDPNMHPQERKQKAKQALYDLPDTGFLAGWTGWTFGKSRVIPEEEAVPVVHTPVPVHDVELEIVVPTPEVVEEEVAPEPEPVAEPVRIPQDVDVKAPHVRGEAIERLKPFSRFKIKNVYEDEDFPVDAVMILQPDFEYPDWSEERVNKLWKR